MWRVLRLRALSCLRSCSWGFVLRTCMHVFSGFLLVSAGPSVFPGLALGFLSVCFVCCCVVPLFSLLVFPYYLCFVSLRVMFAVVFLDLCVVFVFLCVFFFGLCSLVVSFFPPFLSLSFFFLSLSLSLPLSLSILLLQPQPHIDGQKRIRPQK